MKWYDVIWCLNKQEQEESDSDGEEQMKNGEREEFHLLVSNVNPEKWVTEWLREDSDMWW